MSMADLEEAFRRIAEAGNAHFAGPREERLIELAEQTLRLTFPPTYRRFLGQLGAGDGGGQEFYGVIDADFENACVPDAIWLTLTERQEVSLPHSLILIGSTGDGGYYAIDRSRTDALDESPVVEWWPIESPGIATRQLADDFGGFMLQQIRDATS